MSQELTRVIDAIKQDPHGEVGRNVAHWLAVDMMGWRFMIDPLGEEVYEYPFETMEYLKLQKQEGNKQTFTLENTVTHWMATKYWQPFTDAHHTRMLWQALCEKCEKSASELAYDLYVNLLTQEPVDVVLSILNDEDCRHYIGLTDETLKGF